MIHITGAMSLILRQGSLDTVAHGRVVQENTSNKRDFVYFAAKSIEGNVPNGNGDYFPWDHLLKSFASFIGRSLFLNHNSGSPLNAIGKVLDAYPVIDDKTGEKYIECLAKIDAVAHPELARQIESGILDAVSMGCSVESSQCSVCGHTIYSDQDQKCHHMSKGLGQEYHAELDFPEIGIKKGSSVKAFAVNRGLNFTELSVVNVPAWSNAKIVQVIAKLKERVNNEPELGTVLKDLEETLKMSDNLKKEAEAVPAQPESKEPAAAPELPIKKEEESRESRLTRIFKEKLSALDFLDLQAFMKKETEKIEVKAEEKCKCGEIMSKCKCEKKEEKKEEKKAAAEMPPALAEDKKDKKEEKKEEKEDVKNLEEAKAKIEKVLEHEKEEVAGMKLKAIFVSKKELKNSYWVVTNDGKPMIKASLGEIWGDKLNEISDYASSPTYGEALLQRLREDGVKKVALLTNATIYVEAAKPPEGAANGVEVPVKTYTGNQGQTMPGKESPSSAAMRNPGWKPKDAPKEDVDKMLPGCEPQTGKQSFGKEAAKLPEGVDLETKDTGPASRGPVGNGDKWPAGKSVGKDQYTPAAPVGHAKMAEKEEGVDMSGGDNGPASRGPVGSGEQYPTTKQVGKDEYKLAGPVTKEAAADAPVLDMPPAEMPAEAPKAEMPAELPASEAKAEKPISEMSPEELVAHMMECARMMAEKELSKKMQKPVEAVEKAVEKVEIALTKEQEAAAKEAEKEAAAKAREDEKAAKAKEKEDAAAAKEAEKAAKAAEKAEKKEEKKEPKEEKAEEKKEEKKEEKAEEKKEEKMEKVAEVAPVVEPQLSDREKELENQLMQIKLEQSLRAKALRCQAIVNDMIEKDLISADDSDVQQEIAEGKPLFDARAAAFKKAIDKQCRDLLAMEEPTLQAFSQTVKRVKGRNISASPVLKKAFRLEYNENSSEDSWLTDVFSNMGSQKKQD